MCRCWVGKIGRLPVLILVQFGIKFALPSVFCVLLSDYGGVNTVNSMSVPLKQA